MAKSGKEIGADNVQRLTAYLRSTPDLPVRNGKINASAIAKACGFARSVLYVNPTARALLDEATAGRGLAGLEAGEPDSDDNETRRLQRRLSRLEQENAAYRAEAEELRRRLRLLEHVETHLVETGRRIIP